MNLNNHNTHINGGGTAIILINKFTPRSANDTVTDPLGRWMSVMIQGKGEAKTRIVSVYAPHTKGGQLSATSQHWSHHSHQKNETDPCKLFWIELTVQIKKWREAGEQLVLGGDWNTDSDSTQIHALKEEFNLKEVHKEMHQQAPMTRHPGSKTTDFFLLTAGLQFTKSRHTRAGGGVSEDHCAQ